MELWPLVEIRPSPQAPAQDRSDRGSPLPSVEARRRSRPLSSVAQLRRREPAAVLQAEDGGARHCIAQVMLLLPPSMPTMIA
jgi:hypothetical protein